MVRHEVSSNDPIANFEMKRGCLDILRDECFGQDSPDSKPAGKNYNYYTYSLHEDWYQSYKYVGINTMFRMQSVPKNFKK